MFAEWLRDLHENICFPFLYGGWMCITTHENHKSSLSFVSGTQFHPFLPMFIGLGTCKAVLYWDGPLSHLAHHPLHWPAWALQRFRHSQPYLEMLQIQPGTFCNQSRCPTMEPYRFLWDFSAVFRAGKADTVIWWTFKLSVHWSLHSKTEMGNISRTFENPSCIIPDHWSGRWKLESQHQEGGIFPTCLLSLVPYIAVG